MIIHVLEHALTDTIKLIPFLFLTYCLNIWSIRPRSIQQN